MSFDMSDTELETLCKELDKFIVEYRNQEWVTKAESKEDREIISNLITNMLAYEKGRRQYLKFKEHPNPAIVPEAIAKGTVRMWAEHMQVSIDRANSYRLLEVSEDKLKECTELRKQLNEAQQEIERLRNLVRLLHGDPDKPNNSFTSNVE